MTGVLIFMSKYSLHNMHYTTFHLQRQSTLMKSGDISCVLSVSRFAKHSKRSCLLTTDDKPN